MDGTVDAASDQETRIWLMQHRELRDSAAFKRTLTNVALRRFCVRLRKPLPRANAIDRAWSAVNRTASIHLIFSTEYSGGETNT
jgi:hypothetical protein